MDSPEAESEKRRNIRMKNWLKTLCAAAIIGSMALTVAAEDAAALTLPEPVHAEQVRITSSLASDETDLVPLYDLSADTAVTFAGAAEGVSVSMTAKEAFRLHSIVVNETETAYEAALYASNDGENWVEVKFDTKEEDGFVLYKAKGLARDYKFYRLTAQTEEGELSFHTLAMYQKVQDVWPFALWRIFG